MDVTDKQEPATPAAEAGEAEIARPAPPETPKATPGRSGPGLLAPAALLLAVVALLLGAYDLWRLQQRLPAMEAQLTEVGGAIAERDRQAARLDDLQQRLATIDRQLADQQDPQAEIERLQQDLQALRQQVQGLQGGVTDARRAWIRAEAGYLLQVANQQLQLRNDPAAATKALQLADANLRRLDDPSLTPVREVLAEEIAALRALPAQDPAGLVLQLTAIAQQVEQWPLAEQVPSVAPVATEVDTGNARRLMASLERIARETVVVRRQDEPVAPLAAPVSVALQRLLVQGQLATARLAVLRQEGKLFRAQIDAALASIPRYFDAEAPAVNSALQTLHELRDTTLEVAAPDISRSLSRLRALDDESAS